MNIKVKAIALLLASVTALSFTGCSQTLKCTGKNGVNRSIKVTGGTKLYDSYGIIDGFKNGKATGTWIIWNDTQYYNAKTTNAKTTSLIKFTCTATLKQVAVSSETKTKTLTGIVNYNGNGKSFSSIKLGGDTYK